MNLREILREKIRTSSNEDVINSTVKEVEITIYAKVKNVDEVEQLAVERRRFEQWEIPVDSDDGRLRIRAIDDVQFQLTSKTYEKGFVGALEHTTMIAKEQFMNIKKMCDNGYFKTRLTIPMRTSSLKWEVDLHYTKGGSGYSNWVKIDLENVSTLNDVPEDVPFECSELIVVLPGDEELPEQDKRTIDHLWEEEWVKIK